MRPTPSSTINSNTAQMTSHAGESIQNSMLALGESLNNVGRTFMQISEYNQQRKIRASEAAMKEQAHTEEMKARAISNQMAQAQAKNYDKYGEEQIKSALNAQRADTYLRNAQAANTDFATKQGKVTGGYFMGISGVRNPYENDIYAKRGFDMGKNAKAELEKANPLGDIPLLGGSNGNQK